MRTQDTHKPLRNLTTETGTPSLMPPGAGGRSQDMNWDSASIGEQIKRAEALVMEGKEAQAEAMLVRLTTACPAEAHAWHLLGTARYRQGSYAEAADAFRRRLALAPNDPVAAYSLGI